MITHDSYRLETEERGDSAGIESAYRRGYFQGYFRAMDAIDSGSSLSACEKFLYGLLYKWRYCKHKGKLVPPPIQTRK